MVNLFQLLNWLTVQSKVSSLSLLKTHPPAWLKLQMFVAFNLDFSQAVLLQFFNLNLLETIISKHIKVHDDA